MQMKLPSVIEVYHDSRKSTYIFTDENEELPKAPKLRGLTERQLNLNHSNLGLKDFSGKNVINEEASENSDISLPKIKSNFNQGYKMAVISDKDEDESFEDDYHHAYNLNIIADKDS